jgi:Fe-S oxidoreductase
LPLFAKAGAYRMSAPETFIDRLNTQVRTIADACTACGACVRACPMPGLTGLDAGDGAAVAAGVVDILRTGRGSEDAAAWAQACCGSGHCLTVCEEGINPRVMLAMARRALAETQPEAERKAAGKQSFKAMSRGVRVLSRLQLPPDLMARLSPSSHPERRSPPEIVFYTGCNMLKTPHIGLLCLDVLDALDVSYEVYGGPSNCCGILQFRPGDTANAGRQIGTTMERFRKTGAGQVVSWCPTCQMQMSETLTAVPDEPDPFETLMMPVFLAGRLDALRPLMTEPVAKRVALHEFPGSPGVVDAVKALLSAIPGLELVDLKHPGVGYQMSSLDILPDLQRGHIAGTFRQAEDLGVEVLAGVFHADHRELVGHQSEWPFEIVNYMELIGESMGLRRPDLFKRFKMMQDADEILAAAREMIEAHGLDADEVREVVISDILEDQKLPRDRSRHPAE